LKYTGFRVSRLKTKYLHCYFSGREEAGGDVTIDGLSIPKVEKFKYLVLIVQHNGEIDEDINQCIKVGWQKWKQVTGVLCDKRMSVRLKGKVYHTVVRPAILYGSEC